MESNDDLIKLKALVDAQEEKVRLLEILEGASYGWRSDRINGHKKRLASQRLHDERDLMEVYEAQLDGYQMDQDEA